MSIRRTPPGGGNPPDRSSADVCSVWSADGGLTRKVALLQAKHHDRVATPEDVKRQLVAATTELDGNRTAYLFSYQAAAKAPADGWDVFALLHQEPDAVEVILRDAHKSTPAPISLDLDERASAVVVQALAEAVDRVTRVAQASEAAGDLFDADHQFEEAQNLRAHLDAVRDARIDRGWSADGLEPPEEPEPSEE